MDLHRTTGQPDWNDIAANQRNVWQRLAAYTNGFVTPGNVLTMIGFILVIIGSVYVLHQQYLAGLIVIAAGRFCDLLDGWIAQATGTKSPFGAALDSTVDKFAVLIMFTFLLAAGLMPMWAGVAIIAINGIVSLPVLFAKSRGTQINTERSGKFGMTTTWLAVLLYVIAALIDGQLRTILQVGGLVFLIVSLVFGVYTAIVYTKKYLARQP